MFSDYTIFGIERVTSMDCSVMTRLKAIEEQARKLCSEQSEYELQIVYGQHSLEARRVHELHFMECGLCQNAVEGENGNDSTRFHV
jgi:hypothetical protein